MSTVFEEEQDGKGMTANKTWIWSSEREWGANCTARRAFDTKLQLFNQQNSYQLYICFFCDFTANWEGCKIIGYLKFFCNRLFSCVFHHYRKVDGIGLSSAYQSTEDVILAFFSHVLAENSDSDDNDLESELHSYEEDLGRGYGVIREKSDYIRTKGKG